MATVPFCLEEMKLFDDIRPYNDAETVKALKRCASHPVTPFVSKYIFPEDNFMKLSHVLRSCKGVRDFQTQVMCPAIKQCLLRTSDGFEVSGIENVDKSRRHLFVSNHRDIVMDPALTQYALLGAGFDTTDICVGSNLLSNRLIEDIMRSNRMIEVRRGLASHERYMAASQLSAFVRHLVADGCADVWIAQRQGRAKDSRDSTSQSVLKMFSMSGKGSFSEMFDELSIVPLSISYEYESCDIRRAREIYISRRQKYAKSRLEDVISMKTGIFQNKGHIHLSFCKPVTMEELKVCEAQGGNNSFKALCRLLDKRIGDAYHPFPTNYMAVDLLRNTHDFEKQYEGNTFGSFSLYIDKQVACLKDDMVEDKEELRDILLKIYANPVIDKL